MSYKSLTSDITAIERAVLNKIINSLDRLFDGEKMRVIAFLLFGFFPLTSLALESTGTVCLGVNFSKLLDEHTQVHLTVNNSPKIFFERPYNNVPPKIIARNLNLSKTHTVRIFYKNEVVRSWKFNFQDMSASSVLIWRGAGAWKMKVNEATDCVIDP